MLCLRLTYTEPKLTRLNFTTYRQSILLFKFPTLFLKKFLHSKAFIKLQPTLLLHFIKNSILSFHTKPDFFF